ncbi:uncharacterized protein LOC132380540 isoform X1 [Hypanus sabinus]|uniref:uncharacterized protein LOC132380540 isoform X1 n=1 Tax=Hypanus sabinus TaxID=79690 RepID=UPI0028C3C76B|nr:uncharacterized protein LOC132380540 isoform X1 [Hypanus sabinus]XP_059805409.1 uncharacterized protein LOC132380540 isoform X1 [Hypanus sabinus]
MDLPRSSSAILLIMLIGRSTEVLVKAESIVILTTTYRCSPSSEKVVNLSAYNLSCDTPMASINNKPVIVPNNFSPPITNSTPGKNFTIRGCHTIQYICEPSIKSGNVEKRIIISGMENHINNTDEGIKDSGGHLTDGMANHMNNTDEGIKDSGGHLTDGMENHINNTDEGIKDSGGHLIYGIENHKNNTNEGEKSSRNRFTLGIPLGFVIFIVLVLVIVAIREKIKRCCQQEEFSRSQRLSALQEVV